MKKMISKSVKTTIDKKATYQDYSMMTKASNLLLHQTKQIDTTVPSLSTELMEEINIILRDIEEQLIQTIHKLVDLFKSA